MHSRKSDLLKFGFFFLASGVRSSALYFAGFQRGATADNAHQVVIAEVLDAASTHRKVAYSIDPNSVGELDEPELEVLCRLAVAQFLDRLPMDNFLCQALPLNKSGQQWGGTFQPIRLAAFV